MLPVNAHTYMHISSTPTSSPTDLCSFSPDLKYISSGDVAIIIARLREAVSSSDAETTVKGENLASTIIDYLARLVQVV